MGNRHVKSGVENTSSVDGVYTQKRDYFDQDRTSLNSSLLGRSFASVSSHQSTYSVSRPWSRVSRRRWKESTLTSSYQSSKTAWPVAQIESIFLPEFPITALCNHKKFEVIGEISKGAFGKVYRVKNRETGEIYALKVLSKSKVITESTVQQVKDEVRIQALCGHHPFIVNSPLRWQNKRRLFIVSDYVEGGEFYDLLKKCGILPSELTQLYVAQIALALDFLHNAGVIYRDLKPENILLDGDGNTKLIDFGLSKWLSLGTTTKTVCGTLKYMAPEIISLKPYGHAVDWWSLGVLTCLMLTAKFPSAVLPDDYTPDGQHKPGALPPNVDLDLSSRDLLLRLLEVDPTRRLRSLRTLQTIAFFKGYNFDNVKHLKVKPNELLRKYFPNIDEQLEDQNNVTLDNFDEIVGEQMCQNL